MAYLNEAQHKLVSDAVEAAELTTSGEIVTVLADRSDGYSDVTMVYAAAAAFTAMSLFAFVPAPFLELWDAIIGGWMHEWTTGEIASMTIALGLIAFAVTWALFLWEPLKFAAIPGPRLLPMNQSRRRSALMCGARRWSICSTTFARVKSQKASPSGLRMWA